MTINLSLPQKESEIKPRITVIGVGGAGGNAVNNMISAALEGVEFIVANTDAQALGQSLADRRVQLGITITQGLGAGARPEVGRQAAEEALPVLEKLVSSAQTAIEQRNADVLSYYTARNNLLQKRIQLTKLQEQLLEAHTALEIASGRYLPMNTLLQPR